MQRNRHHRARAGAEDVSYDVTVITISSQHACTCKRRIADLLQGVVRPSCAMCGRCKRRTVGTSQAVVRTSPPQAHRLYAQHRRRIQGCAVIVFTASVYIVRVESLTRCSLRCGHDSMRAHVGSNRVHTDTRTQTQTHTHAHTHRHTHTHTLLGTRRSLLVPGLSVFSFVCSCSS